MFLALKNFHELSLTLTRVLRKSSARLPDKKCARLSWLPSGWTISRVEAIYFTGHGQRGAVIIVEISDASKIPSIAELWFLTFNAIVELKIVKTPDDL
jgi:hypothetical protein